MWAFVVDALAGLLRQPRQRSQMRRLQAAADMIERRSNAGQARFFSVQPWRLSVPVTVAVQLARAAGYRPQHMTSQWMLCEPIRMERDPAVAPNPRARR